jgi:hypothetical protein
MNLVSLFVLYSLIPLFFVPDVANAYVGYYNQTTRLTERTLETLLRARAIETQSYVLAPAQIGEHFTGRSSYGKAMIIDPWGTVVAQCNDDPSVSSPSEDSGRFCLAEYVHTRSRTVIVTSSLCASLPAPTAGTGTHDTAGREQD